MLGTRLTKWIMTLSLVLLLHCAAFGQAVNNAQIHGVVHDPAAMKQLEQIVHPMLGASRQKFFEAAEAAGKPVVVVDVPLLYETGGEKRVDAVVVVTTSPEIQRERILARDNMTAEKLDHILARQIPDAEKRKRADFVVDTSHGLDPVRSRIRDILAEAAKMPSRRS